MSGVFNDIERLIGRVIRRDISRLTDFARGHLQRAAISLTEVERPHVGIVAGFFIRHANPPSPETDGLNGMGQLAAALTEAGIRVTGSLWRRPLRNQRKAQVACFLPLSRLRTGHQCSLPWRSPAQAA
jgi:hypothetical protein